MSKLFASGVSKQLESAAKQIAKHSATDLAKKVAMVSKEAAIHTGKTAIDKGLDKGLEKILTLKINSRVSMYTGLNKEQLTPATAKAGIKSYSHKQLNNAFNTLTPKNQALLSKILKPPKNINNLIDGSGHHPKSITLQDVVKQMNGSGLKVIK